MIVSFGIRNMLTVESSAEFLCYNIVFGIKKCSQLASDLT